MNTGFRLASGLLGRMAARPEKVEHWGQTPPLVHARFLGFDVDFHVNAEGAIDRIEHIREPSGGTWMAEHLTDPVHGDNPLAGLLPVEREVIEMRLGLRDGVAP